MMKNQKNRRKDRAKMAINDIYVVSNTSEQCHKMVIYLIQEASRFAEKFNRLKEIEDAKQ